MRKRVIHQGALEAPAYDQDWLDLERLVQAELTSEDSEYPLEAALGTQGGAGWRAQQSGKQTIRLLFDEPRRISRRLVFEENDQPRTQEFTLRWSPDGGVSWQEIVRQQYNFSPPHSSREVEDYVVDIEGLTQLELNIIPDISGGESRASPELCMRQGSKVLEAYLQQCPDSSPGPNITATKRASSGQSRRKSHALVGIRLSTHTAD